MPGWLPLGYTLLLYVLSPALVLHALILALRNGDARYLYERLGLYRTQRRQKPLWIHAASVGEVICAEPLVRLLQQRLPDRCIILTTSTPTGGQVARQRLRQSINQYYLPIDFPGAVRRFFRTFDPCCALVMETEVWLNLYHACGRRRTPLLVVNGRLSSRTLNAPAWARPIYAAALSNVNMILARSQRDADGFLDLGAAPVRLKVIGNLKFATTIANSTSSNQAALPRPYVLAASTHANEELRLLRAWQARDRGSHLLVIAPRHPARLKDILQEIEPLSSHIAIRSRGDGIDQNTSVYLVDTLGELPGFMVNAEAVFMGGSLTPHGGHNVLEPARLGRAIVFGPHMENFEDEAKTLLQCEAALQVTNDQELESRLTELLRSPDFRVRLGDNAAAAIQERQHIAERYVAEIMERCPHA
ncbi:MAG: 3-deoxy-D-manno-octulosonic acid transferase [Acidiferrobacterales bacterium]|nr:3-deoxy-D-manno-octulosonic acid transferase [Acidiferrobacterales bacterium]